MPNPTCKLLLASQNHQNTSLEVVTDSIITSNTQELPAQQREWIVGRASNSLRIFGHNLIVLSSSTDPEIALEKPKETLFVWYTIQTPISTSLAKKAGVIVYQQPPVARQIYLLVGRVSPQENYPWWPAMA
jgi:hypothetical protein